MGFVPYFRDFRSDLKGLRPHSRNITSDFKDFRDFTSDFNVFKLDFRDFWSDSRITDVEGISGILGRISGHLYIGFQKQLARLRSARLQAYGYVRIPVTRLVTQPCDERCSRRGGT